MADRKRIQAATGTASEDDNSEALVHSVNRPNKGLFDDSDSEEEDAMKHEAEDDRANRIRMIRAMRQTVARAAAAGPTANGSDVEVAV